MPANVLACVFDANLPGIEGAGSDEEEEENEPEGESASQRSQPTILLSFGFGKGTNFQVHFIFLMVFAFIARKRESEKCVAGLADDIFMCRARDQCYCMNFRMLCWSCLP